MPGDLFLVQHGAALPESADPRRPLSSTGRSDLIRVASAFRSLNGFLPVSVGRLYTSDKDRAVQTAQLLLSLLQIRQGLLVGQGQCEEEKKDIEHGDGDSERDRNVGVDGPAFVLKTGQEIVQDPQRFKPGADPTLVMGDLYQELIKEGENVLVVGHLPFLNKLSNLLICGDHHQAEQSADGTAASTGTRPHVIAFQNGAVVRLSTTMHIHDAVDMLGKWQVSRLISLN